MLEDHARRAARVAQRASRAGRRRPRRRRRRGRRSALSSPLTRRISVDLPAPERPITPSDRARGHGEVDAGERRNGRAAAPRREGLRDGAEADDGGTGEGRRRALERGWSLQGGCHGGHFVLRPGLGGEPANGGVRVGAAFELAGDGQPGLIDRGEAQRLQRAQRLAHGEQPIWARSPGGGPGCRPADRRIRESRRRRTRVRSGSMQTWMKLRARGAFNDRMGSGSARSARTRGASTRLRPHGRGGDEVRWKLLVRDHDVLQFGGAHDPVVAL